MKSCFMFSTYVWNHSLAQRLILGRLMGGSKMSQGSKYQVLCHTALAVSFRKLLHAHLLHAGDSSYLAAAGQGRWERDSVWMAIQYRRMGCVSMLWCLTLPQPCYICSLLKQPSLEPFWGDRAGRGHALEILCNKISSVYRTWRVGEPNRNSKDGEEL